MHSLQTIKEIKRLLADGAISQRQIAKKLGVARGTVNAIASGKRGVYGRESKRRSERADATPDWPCEMPQGRCPVCGFTGYLPCVACEARAYQRRQHSDCRRAA